MERRQSDGTALPRAASGQACRAVRPPGDPPTGGRAASGEPEAARRGSEIARRAAPNRPRRRRESPEPEACSLTRRARRVYGPLGDLHRKLPKPRPRTITASGGRLGERDARPPKWAGQTPLLDARRPNPSDSRQRRVPGAPERTLHTAVSFVVDGDGRPEQGPRPLVVFATGYSGTTTNWSGLYDHWVLARDTWWRRRAFRSHSVTRPAEPRAPTTRANRATSASSQRKCSALRVRVAPARRRGRDRRGASRARGEVVRRDHGARRRLQPGRARRRHRRGDRARRASRPQECASKRAHHSSSGTATPTRSWRSRGARTRTDARDAPSSS